MFTQLRSPTFAAAWATWINNQARMVSQLRAVAFAAASFTRLLPFVQNHSFFHQAIFYYNLLHSCLLHNAFWVISSFVNSLWPPPFLSLTRSVCSTQRQCNLHHPFASTKCKLWWLPIFCSIHVSTFWILFIEYSDELQMVSGLPHPSLASRAPS